MCYTKGVGADVMGSESPQSTVIAAGETMANISVKIIDDVEEEDSEMLLVMLVGSNCVSQPLPDSTAAIEIVDDDEGIATYINIYIYMHTYTHIVLYDPKIYFNCSDGFW